MKKGLQKQSQPLVVVLEHHPEPFELEFDGGRGGRAGRRRLLLLLILLVGLKLRSSSQICKPTTATIVVIFVVTVDRSSSDSVNTSNRGCANKGVRRRRGGCRVG
jgi:hypothetical protein